MTVNAVVDDRTLREVYLPQFEAAVKEAHVGSVMCSYNRLDGPYACENGHLLHDILERDWAFPGYVIADYGAAHDTPADLTGGLDFGPGLAYAPALVTASTLTGAASPSTVDVTNTGTRSGVAVPQLYVGLPSPGPGIVQPPRQLRGYTKVGLRPGERRRVSFTRDERALSYWDTADGAWRVAPGCYGVMVGSSSRDLLLRGSSCRR